MNENEFELDGKVYVAVDAECGCNGCAFNQVSVRDCNAYAAPYCTRKYRIDNRNVIFVEKQQ